jgi:hypothetical protein
MSNVPTDELCAYQVVGVSKLRTKYESHEAKRILAGAYDLFVADERVIPSLPKLLGVQRRQGPQDRTSLMSG